MYAPFEYRLSFFEIIVVNDGSKDATIEKMITQYQMKEINAAVRKQVETKSVKKFISPLLFQIFF